MSLQILPYLGAVISSGFGLTDFYTAHTIQTPVLPDFQSLLRNGIHRTFLDTGLAIGA